MEYIRVELMDLPGTIRGFTVMIDTDCYIIVINSRLNDIQQKNIYDHEIKHINNQDFNNMYDVNLLEHLRHA